MGIVSDYLTEKGVISDETDKFATNTIKLLSEREILIAGNRIGLIVLADYIVRVALADFSGWHFHLDESNFFDDTNLELIIRLDKDDPDHPIGDSQDITEMK